MNNERNENETNWSRVENLKLWESTLAFIILFPLIWYKGRIFQRESKSWREKKKKKERNEKEEREGGREGGRKKELPEYYL